MKIDFKIIIYDDKGVVVSAINDTFKDYDAVCVIQDYYNRVIEAKNKKISDAMDTAVIRALVTNGNAVIADTNTRRESEIDKAV